MLGQNISNGFTVIHELLVDTNRKLEKVKAPTIVFYCLFCQIIVKEHIPRYMSIPVIIISVDKESQHKNITIQQVSISKMLYSTFVIHLSFRYIYYISNIVYLVNLALPRGFAYMGATKYNITKAFIITFGFRFVSVKCGI